MIKIELLYDAIGPKRRTTMLELPDGAKIRDVLKKCQEEGFEIGYMQIWLNQEPLNDPTTSLDLDVPDHSVLHIKMVERWELD
jgi:hypothetical protein